MRDFMIRKRMDVETTFLRFLSDIGMQREGKVNRMSWRDALKKEGLPFNVP